MRVIGVLHTFYWYNYARLGKAHNYFPRNDFFYRSKGEVITFIQSKEIHKQIIKKENLGDALEIAFFIIGQAGPQW